MSKSFIFSSLVHVKFALLAAAVTVFAGSAFAQLTGTQVSAKSTIPHGALFLNDANGGHWWVTDSIVGTCALIGSPAALTQCNGTATNAGQPAATPFVSATATRFVFVPDGNSASTNIVRFTFDPAKSGTLSNPVTFTVQNNTSVGGGTRGGRPSAVALFRRATAAANGGSFDLYVAYAKSGDIMRVDGVDGTPSTVGNKFNYAQVASTSDARGIYGLTFVGNDLYIAEAGGGGVSKIQDPSGVTRAACNATAPCTAVIVPGTPTALPGGIGTDGKVIYVADVSLTAAQSSVYRYDPATAVSSVFSTNINPSYTAPDLNGVSKVFTAYATPLAIGYRQIDATGNAELYVGDDPQSFATTVINQQGHFWTVAIAAPAAIVPSVTSISPTSGPAGGGTTVSVTGTNLTANGVLPTIAFGGVNGTGVACASVSSCTVVSPAGTGGAIVDVIVTLSGQSSSPSAADKFTYVTPSPTAPTVTSISPTSGSTIGGTIVTINGTNLGSAMTVAFGAVNGTNIQCGTSTTTCTVASPAEAAGSVDVLVTNNNQTSAPNAAARFTFVAPTPNLYAWGITAPKGGAVWIPGNLGGHFWTSDHAQGLCRQDLMSSAPTQFLVSGSTLHGMNYSSCAPDAIGSAGQAAYDPNGTPLNPSLHYVYVPDNATKSTAVWRLTLDPTTETFVADPQGGAMATQMIALGDMTTLKPNGVALGPDGALYVADLTEMNIRKITSPNADPRTQTVAIVAQTGDGRGANGTMGFIGNLLYVPGNRAAQFFDITQCPLTTGPCGMASIPAPTGIFVAGLATYTDATHKLVYVTDSPGAASSTVYRYDATNDKYVAFAPGTYPADAFGVVTCTACTTGTTAATFVTGGVLPAPGTANGTVTVALTAQRPWDQTNHSTAGFAAGSQIPTGFAFVFGLTTKPNNGNLMITEDPTAGARSGRGTMWEVPFVP